MRVPNYEEYRNILFIKKDDKYNIFTYCLFDIYNLLPWK